MNKKHTAPHLLFAKAVKEHERGNLPVAEELYKRCISMGKDSYTALFFLGLIYHQRGEGDAALEFYQRAYRGLPQNPSLLTSLGSLFLEKGDFTHAEHYLSAVLDVKPNDADALGKLGLLCLQTDRNQDAKQYYEQVLSQDKCNYSAANNLGLALTRIGDKEGAEQKFKLALEIYPGYKAARMNLGNLFWHSGEFSTALIMYKSALDISETADVHFNIGLMYSELNQGESACHHFKRALELNPGFVEARRGLIVELQNQEKVDDVSQWLANAPEQQLITVAQSCAYGMMAFDCGDFHEAITRLSKTSRVDSKSVAPWRFLGDVYKANFQLEEAKSCYEKAARLAPASDDGVASLVYLACLNYLDLSWSAVRVTLTTINPFPRRNDKQFKALHAYYNYLGALVSWYEGSHEAEINSGGQKFIYAIGDSHCLSAHGTRVSYEGETRQIEARWIEGCKQWHLANSLSNSYKAAMNSAMTTVPEGATVLILLGEIDCRVDEGLFPLWRHNPSIPLSRMIQDTIQPFVRFIACAADNRKYDLIFGGIPASNASFVGISEELAWQYGEMLTQFNRELRSHALSIGAGFLDMFTLTNAVAGRSGGKWHLDMHHLVPAAYTEAFKHHLVRRIHT